MKIRILTVGELENSHYKALNELYIKRLKHYATIETEFIKQEKISTLSDDEILNNEAEKLLKKISSKDYNVALDKSGVQMSSEEFSLFFGKQMTHSMKTVTFIIGGPLGLSYRVTQTANMKLSFSAMTFPHELAAVVLMEQIYRAHTILKGEKYHK